MMSSFFVLLFCKSTASFVTLTKTGIGLTSKTDDSCAEDEDRLDSTL